jgi:hypothetical protein
MPIHKVEFDGDTVSLWKDSQPTGVNSVSVTTVKNSLPPPRRVDGDEVAGLMQDLLQGMMEFRQSRNSLPDEDPDKATDPARPDLFWDGQFLVSRPVLVEFTWNASETQYEIKITKLNS